MASYTVFQAQTPALTDLNDSDDYALGTVVLIGATDNGGQITHARHYASTTPPSEPIAWRVSALDTLDLLGSHTFTDDTPGWVEETLAAPVEVPPEGMNVLVWIGTEDRYVATTNYFTSGAGSAGVTNGPLTAPASGADPEAIGNGRFGGDPTSPPAGTISGGNYFVDLVFTENEAPPPAGTAALGLELTLAAVGNAPDVPMAEGVASLELALTVAGTGDAPAIDPGQGTAALGIEYTLAGTGETPAVGPAEGEAALGLVLTVAATGNAPSADPGQGVAELGIAYSFAGEGETPAVDPAQGTVALSLVLAVAGVGDNGESFPCRPVRSFAEVMPS